MAQQPVAEVRRHERLARPVAICTSARGRFARSDSSKPRNRLDLSGPQPRGTGLQFGQQRQPGPQCGMAAEADVLVNPVRQRLGPMEGEHPATGRNRVQPAGEARLRTRGLVAERQRPVHLERGQLLRVGRLILAGLRLHAGEGAARLLGLDHPDGLAIHEQDVISRTRLRRHLPNRHALSCGHRGVLVVLHHPPAGFKLGINLHPSPRLRRQIVGRRITAQHEPSWYVGTGLGGLGRSVGRDRLDSGDW